MELTKESIKQLRDRFESPVSGKILPNTSITDILEAIAVYTNQVDELECELSKVEDEFEELVLIDTISDDFIREIDF
jgi:chorismate-pyruvate lyase